jgi:hypothetical protein
MLEQVLILSNLKFFIIHPTFQVQHLQFSSNILEKIHDFITGSGSTERHVTSNVPAETTDMDSENVNEEELDLTGSSVLNSKEMS